MKTLLITLALVMAVGTVGADTLESHARKQQTWTYTIYPWGFALPSMKKGAIPANQPWPAEVCKREALKSLGHLIEDFEGIATIDPPTAKITCETQCFTPTEYPALSQCEQVYRWRGDGVGWNPGDEAPMSLVERRRFARSYQEGMKLLDQWEALMDAREKMEAAR